MRTTAFLKTLTLGALALGTALLPVEAANPDAIEGIWLTENGKSKVQISEQGGHLSGRLIWLKDPLRDGKPKLDMHNESASLRGRPLIGLTLIHGFSFKNGRWEDGKIYNPEDGKTYSCTLALKDPGTLEVRGYVLNPLLGKTQTWKKAR
jgi:uncharacterized protein (DUF2147 family)